MEAMKWELDDIKTAEQRVHELWRDFAPDQSAEASSPVQAPAAKRSRFDISVEDERTSAPRGDALKLYLAQPLVDEGEIERAGGLLGWWEGYGKSVGNKELAVFAISVLSAPGKPLSLL
jgi:hypothetical protein